MPKKKVREDVDRGKDRDDLIEAGKRLRAAKVREEQESNLGVKACKKAWEDVKQDPQ